MMKLTEFACIEVKMNKELINYVSISTAEISADIFITLHSQTRETHLKKKIYSGNVSEEFFNIFKFHYRSLLQN